MRLIDADAMIEHLRKDPLFDFVERYGITGVIEAQPTVDAVPLIRCKDCKYWGADVYRYGCKYATGVMFENDHCSRAERKEGADKC